VILTAANLYYYLEGAGFASAESVVAGEFRVKEVSRRNHAFRVTHGDRPGYAIKQIKKWDASRLATLQAEVHWYWLLQNEPRFAPLARLVPGCRAYDADNQILILDAPRDWRDLDRHHSRLRRYPVESAELLGETLAQFHQAVPAPDLIAMRDHFREQPPAILRWHETPDPLPDTLSQGVVALLQILREHALFAEAFDRLRLAWRGGTLINGDMKFGHCILTGDDARLYLIDWELADYGDPGWDIAAILQDYLSGWLRSMPGGAEDAGTLVQKAKAPLTEIQPAIRAFWRRYSETAHAPPDLERTVSYAAAWLIQRAYESLQEAKQMTPRAARMAQLSLNILRAPADAAHGLFGI
jgi:hypothetical protein